MADQNFTRADELMALANINAAASAMNYNADSSAVDFAHMGMLLYEAKLEAEDFESLVRDELRMPLGKANKAIRFYEEFKEILQPDFVLGANNPINLRLREHPESPATEMLNMLCEIIDKHPDNDKKAAEL